MLKKIEELSIDEINEFDFLEKEDLEKLSFGELCVYQEILNKIKARYDQLVNNV